MARTYPFQEPATMKLFVFTLFCFMACALGCRFVPRDCPEQCECSPCLPEFRCDGENVTNFNFTQSLSWVYIFAAVNTSIPELQQGTIALPNMPNLRHLELSSNGIHILTEQVSTTNYTRLSVMVLSDNRLSVVPSRMMRLAPNLAYIDLSGNMITVIHSYAFTFNNDLNTILLADNGLQTIEEKAFTGVSELRTLKLSYNSIMGTNLGNWEEFHTSIETISLSGNGLRQMPTLNPNYKFSCKNLSLEHNNFEALDQFALAAFENLTLLNVANNSLSTVDGDLFGEGTHDLVMLYLSRNHLTSVPVSLLARLPKLLNLSLSFNHIATLPSNAFVKNTMLRWIQLDHNMITIVHAMSLNGLDNILHFNIQHNLLTGLPETFLKGRYEFDLILKDNMWSCDCAMKSLKEWFLTNAIENDVQCQIPAEYQGRNVTDVNFEEICEKEEESTATEEIPTNPMLRINIPYSLIGGGVVVLLILIVAAVSFRRKLRTQTDRDTPLCKKELDAENSSNKQFSN